MPPKFNGPKLPICQTPETVSVPKHLDKQITITINDQQIDVEADDLEVICELGKFFYSKRIMIMHRIIWPHVFFTRPRSLWSCGEDETQTD